MVVLDTSALLAFLLRETGHEQVAPALPHACISTLNLAETVGRFVRDGHDAQTITTQLRRVGIEFVPFTEEHATLTASLLPITKRFGLSICDRACLALAKSRDLPVLTADRVWLDVQSLGIEIQVIR